MEFRDVVRRRRMVRSYTDEPVDPDALERILAAGLRAPSAGFTQGWGFLVLDTPEQTAKFWDTTFPDGEARANFAWPGLFAAPVIVVPFSNRDAYLDRYAEADKGWVDRDEDRWPVPYWHIDTGFAAMAMLLAVVDEDLGALFFGVFGPHVPALRAAFGVPEEFTPVGAITIGHPAPDRPSPSLKRGHRPHHDVVHRGRWSSVAGRSSAPEQDGRPSAER
ncbi:MAG TPA: nitroreductase family protein [Acidimicrobiales bacterium]|nr:nitroreductase family protein [Acidimicrobiales bacterium]